MTEIFYSNINNISLKEEYINKLPLYRREKIKRLSHINDKKASLSAGLLIERFLGKSEIKLGEKGKPYAENGRNFNISHSGDYVIIVLSDFEVGCDVEVMREVDFERMGKIVFHENERKILSGSADKKEYFFELWTRKEAFIKCLGEGFSFKTASLDLSGLPDRLEYLGRTFFFKEYMRGNAKIMLCSEDNNLPEKIEEINFTKGENDE